MNARAEEEGLVRGLAVFHAQCRWACCLAVGRRGLPGAIREFTPFQRVVEVTISDESFTDADSSLLKPLAHLTQLTIVGPQFTDAGLQRVASWHGDRLTGLDLDYCSITDAGVLSCGSMPQLRDLSLCSTEVTDRCLPALAAHDALERLYLSSTGISDPGLSAIGTMRSLKVVDLRFTDVSAEAAKGFKNKHPSVSIGW